MAVKLLNKALLSSLLRDKELGIFLIKIYVRLFPGGQIIFILSRFISGSNFGVIPKEIRLGV